MKFILLSLIFIILISTSNTIFSSRHKNKFRKNKLRAQSYDEVLAQRLWRLCILSYCAENSSKKIISTFSYEILKKEFADRKEFTSIQPKDDIRVFQHEKTQDLGFALSDKANQIIYVVFRGTRPWSFSNIYTDLSLSKTTVNGYNVHSGFQNSASYLKDGMLAAISELQANNKNAKLIFTGHSLGGAIAVLSAINYKTQTQKNVDLLYTFGAPKVGDSSFTKYFQDNILKSTTYYRVTHKRDLIPQIPPTTFLNYQEDYPEVYYDDDKESGGYKICSERKDSNCKNQGYIRTSLFDHGLYYGRNNVGDLAKCGFLENTKRARRQYRFMVKQSHRQFNMTKLSQKLAQQQK